MSRMTTPLPKKAFTEPVLSDLIQGISAATSVNFGQYKRSFMQRQILRQLTKHRLIAGQDYIDLAHAGTRTGQEMISEMTVHVTRFFRDPSLFDLLMEDVLPCLWRRHLERGGKEFRIWVIGCATGEEAYSVGMSFLESVHPNLVRSPARIFATDLDDFVVEQARKGEYPLDALDGLAVGLTEKYFIPGKTFRVAPELRRLITFGQHDLLQNAFIHHLDMILCRNVLIFLQREAQDGVCKRLHESLKPGGMLVLGKAETPTHRFRDKGFRTLCRSNRVYQKDLAGPYLKRQGPKGSLKNED